jgi:5'-phosphate synthase pdxT subunit
MIMAPGMKVGVLALQGDVSEHVAALESAMRHLSVRGSVAEARRASEFGGISALLMPGGESTTMAKHIDRFGLRKPIIDFAKAGNPVMGTCAGAILLASEIVDEKGPEHVKPLGLIDMAVRRNAFGRQADSFEKPLNIKGLDPDFPGVFIRAPRIEKIGKRVESLAALDGEPVFVRQGNVTALTFHPELARDARVHALFLKNLRP